MDAATRLLRRLPPIWPDLTCYIWGLVGRVAAWKLGASGLFFKFAVLNLSKIQLYEKWEKSRLERPPPQFQRQYFRPSPPLSGNTTSEAIAVWILQDSVIDRADGRGSGSEENLALLFRSPISAQLLANDAGESAQAPYDVYLRVSVEFQIS